MCQSQVGLCCIEEVLPAQVAGLQVGPEHNTHFEGLFKVWITQLSTILPPGTNLPAAYERGSDQDQDFVQNLAIFLTTFFRVLPPS